MFAARISQRAEEKNVYMYMYITVYVYIIYMSRRHNQSIADASYENLGYRFFLVGPYCFTVLYSNQH